MLRAAKIKSSAALDERLLAAGVPRATPPTMPPSPPLVAREHALLGQRIREP